MIAALHNKIVINKSVIGICIALFVGTFLGYILEKQQPSNQTITVVGNADRAVPADKAQITAAIQTTGATEALAAAENKKQFDTVKATLLSAGLSENAIKVEETTTYQDSPNTNYFSQTVFDINLEDKAVDNVDKYLSILDFYQTEPDVTYSLKDKNKYLNELKQKAIQDAKNQADNLAKVNQLRVGKVITLEDRDTQTDPNFAFDETTDSTEREIPLSSSYSVTYQLTPFFLPF